MKASVLGRIGYDLYAQEQGVALKDVVRFSRYLGGSSANLAVGLSRLGVDVEMISCLGRDPLCDYLVEYLQGEGVETGLVRQEEGLLASLCLCEVSPPDHFPQVFYREKAADTRVEVGPQEKESIVGAQLFVTNGTSLCASPAREATQTAISWAQEAGVTVAFDVDYRDMSWKSGEEAGAAVRALLPRIDILIANELEICLVAGADTVSEAIDRLWGLGVSTLIAKLGSEGTRAVTARESLFVPPFPVEVVSTIGAGDGFASGFLYAHLQGLSLSEAVRYGNAAAAIVVSRLMCAEAMPTRDEVEDLLERNPEAH